MQRSLLLFQNSIHSDETYRIYKYYLDKFIEHYKLRDYNALKSMDSKMFQEMVEDYVMLRKSNGRSRTTINSSICSLQLFCETNDIELRWRKIRRLLPPQKKRSGSKAYTTEQVRKVLDFTPNIRNKAIIHFVAASGVRIGALPDLKIKHTREMPLGCKSVIIYSDEKEEYTAFLTLEASNALDAYLEKRTRDGEQLKPDSPLFRQNYRMGIAKPKPLARVSIQAIVDRALRRAGLRFGKDGTRRDIQLDHGFRKRWNTIVKTTDGMKIILAEKMFGHSTPTIPLDETYVDPTIDKLFEEYKKAIPELTIDVSERLRMTNQKLEREKSELEEKEKGESISNKQLIDELQTQLVQLQFELKAVTTSVQTKYDDELQQRKEKLGIA